MKIQKLQLYKIHYKYFRFIVTSIINEIIEPILMQSAT